MCTNEYSNKERFDKVIAKIRWCSFLPHSVNSYSLLYLFKTPMKTPLDYAYRYAIKLVF